MSRQFLRDLEAARGGISHAVPNATTEQVLQAALCLLLEKQAKARGQVKRPRTAVAATPTETLAGPPAPATQPTAAPTATADPIPAELPTATESTPHRRTGSRETIPAAVRRSTVANLRVACAARNRLAARQVFGARCLGRYVGASGRLLRRHPAGGAPAPLATRVEGDGQPEREQRVQ